MSWSFHSIHELLSMGGYAFYVWAAYGIVILSILLFGYFSCKQ